MCRIFHAYIQIAPLTGCLLLFVVSLNLILRHSTLCGSGARCGLYGLETTLKTLGAEAFTFAFVSSTKLPAVGPPLILVLSHPTALLCKTAGEPAYAFKPVFLYVPISCVAGAALLVQLLFFENGMVNALCLPVREYLSGSHAFWIMTRLYLWKSMGYSMILLLAGLATISGEQYESAELDGASARQCFGYVAPPHMLPLRFSAHSFPSSTHLNASGKSLKLVGNTRATSCTCCGALSTQLPMASII